MQFLRSWSACFLLIPFAPLSRTALDQNTFTIRDNVNLVVLDVSVKEAHAGYVSGLAKSNFRVLEDGRPRSITQFGNVDAPVTIGLVMDNSGSMASKRSEVVEAGLAFSKESNPKDQFFVVNFNNTVIPGLPPHLRFTDNLAVLRRALYYGDPIGQTALYDAMAYALHHLEASRLEQRTLVVVSDGGDNVSKTSLSSLISEIEASRATIYAIGLMDPENRDLKPSVLRKFSAIGGGEYFEPRHLYEVRSIFEHISKDIRSRYTIGFAPDADPSKNDRRSIKVTAERDGKRFAVKARTTFRIPATSGHI